MWNKIRMLKIITENLCPQKRGRNKMKDVRQDEMSLRIREHEKSGLRELSPNVQTGSQRQILKQEGPLI